MSLNKASADALANQICSSLGVTEPTAVDKWKLICEDIFNSLVANAVVAVTSVSGVTTGPGVSGPGAGTLT